MSITFIPASDLKPQYRVLGHFYDLELQEEVPQKCRSLLEITAITASENPVADSIFVMMNPGSSRPVKEVKTTISQGADQLVPTVPDTTQYQVMRVMHYMGWEHVRVINLSDLRDPSSASFAQRYAQLEKRPGAKEHSIFSTNRSAQLKQHLMRKPGAPIVCAWGVSDDLNPLIERARQALELEQELTGLAKSPGAWKYFHPLPLLQRQQEQWVAQILKKLNSEKVIRHWNTPKIER